MYAYRLAYDGRPFHGYQRQPDVRTVEGELFEALAALEVTDGGRPPGYAAAGRTDAGVSALAQTVTVDGPGWLDPAALNSRLPPTVRTWARTTVDEGFHATHDAVGRTYRYHLPDPADRLDPDRLEAAAAALTGEHDLYNLTPATEGTVRDLAVAVEGGAGEGPVAIVCEAGGFVHELVRRVVTLVRAVGTGAASLERVDRVLAPEPLEGPAGIGPAPPEPLVLTGVRYREVAFRAAPAVADRVAGRFREAAGDARARAGALGTVADGIADTSDGAGT